MWWLSLPDFSVMKYPQKRGFGMQKNHPQKWGWHSFFGPDNVVKHINHTHRNRIVLPTPNSKNMKRIWLLLLIAGCIRVAQAQVEYVDPSMGGQGVLLEPTKPTVSLPN